MVHNGVSQPENAALRICGLSKSYGAQTILNDISLDVGHGEFIALLGESGCGKSTLLRLIAGLDSADGGSIWIDGQDVTGASPAARHLSMMFQSYALFPHLNVTRNVSFGLEVRKVPRAEREQRVADALAMTGLTGLGERKPAALSGGQRQRVALARAIVGGHRVCLMDEPLSNLDARLRHTVRHELRSLQRRLGITVIYVTHDQTEAMGMADRIVLMRQGRIEQIGTPQRLYSEPETTYVASFIGAPPMMLLPQSSVPEALRPCSVNRRERVCIYGVRPEEFVLTAPTEHVVSAVITAIEYQGADLYLYVRTTQGDELIVRRRQSALDDEFEADQRIGLKWPVAVGHVFDASTGRRADDVSCFVEPANAPALI